MLAVALSGVGWELDAAAVVDGGVVVEGGAVDGVAGLVVVSAADENGSGDAKSPPRAADENSFGRATSPPRAAAAKRAAAAMLRAVPLPLIIILMRVPNKTMPMAMDANWVMAPIAPVSAGDVSARVVAIMAVDSFRQRR